MNWKKLSLLLWKVPILFSYNLISQVPFQASILLYKTSWLATAQDDCYQSKGAQFFKSVDR